MLKQYLIVIYFIFIELLNKTQCGSIQSWDIEPIEDFDGQTSGFILNFNLESGLSDDDYISVIFPTQITIQSSDLYLFENSLLLIENVVCENSLVNNLQYYCKYGVNLKPNIWYQIKIKINGNVIWSPLPAEMITVSDTCNSILNCSAIIYDVSNYFGYLHRTPQKISLATTIINISYDTTNNQQQLPGQQYYIYIDITPQVQIDYSKGSTYIISINPTTVTRSEYNFKFSESCYSDILNCQMTGQQNCVSIPQIQQSKCEITKKSDQLIFQVNQELKKGQTFRIKTKIENPLNSLKADIKVQGMSKQSQRTEENGIFFNGLESKIIKIFKGKFNFMWGLSQNEQDLLNDVPYTLFKSGIVVPTVNSVFISFQVSQAIPIGKEYYIEVSLGQASGIIENSISTNFPHFDLRKEPKCYQKLDIKTKICYVACESVIKFNQEYYILTINSYYKKQVGALIYANYEYYISVKVQYTQNSLSPGSQSKVTNYGQVNIFVKDSPDILLYQTFIGETIKIYDNSEFIDKNSGLTGFNDQFGLGTTQIVSYADSKQKSGVPDGISNFLSPDRKNTVGITPSDKFDQQLLFFLKVDQIHFDTLQFFYLLENIQNYLKDFKSDDSIEVKSAIGTNVGVDYISLMSILYNPKNIMYEQGYDKMGLDMAAFQLGTSEPDQWSIDQVPCYKVNKCSWYNQTSTSGAKNYLQKSSSSATVQYNIHRFECITQTSSDCYNWRGYQKINGNSGILSMRRVKFSTGFHSQLKVDEDLLDFVISFHLGTYKKGITPQYQLQSVQLINAYTIQKNPLLNAKISFINFSENAINPGHRFPTFLRIGGSISKSEHLDATIIAVFFDESIELKAYVDEQNESSSVKKEIGCSAKNCYLYESNNIFGQDNWMNNNMILATGLNDIENDFNLLIPVQNRLNNGIIVIPKRLVIAFCNFTKTSNNLIQHLKILSVYRVYGAPTQGDITKQITPIFNIQALSPLTFTSDKWASSVSNQSTYKLKMSDVKPQGIIDTELIADASVITNHNKNYKFGQYGAGITISSLNYDLFDPSTLRITNTPFGVLIKCIKFSYTYNDINGSNNDYNKFKIYNVFCPVDAFLSGTGNIQWKNPFYDYAITSGLKLSSFLVYSFSSGEGKIYSYQSETQIVNSSQFNECFISQVMKDLHPISLGKQAIDFSFKIKAIIPFDLSGQKGFGFMRVQIEFSNNLVGLTEYQPSVCRVNGSLSEQFDCQLISFLINAWIIGFTPKKQFSLDLLQNISFTVFVDASSMNAISNVKYNFNVYLPTEKTTGEIRIYGNQQTSSFPVNFILISKCSDTSFLVSAKPYLQLMNLNNLQFEIKNSLTKSSFNFTFVTLSPRERFYSTSYLQFDLGFLSSPYTSNPTLKREYNIRFQIYESLVKPDTLTYDQFSLSKKWKYLEFIGDLRNIKLYPKKEFKDPNLYVFILKCIGCYTPEDSLQSLKIQVKWLDTAIIIQDTSLQGNIEYPLNSDIIDTTNIQTGLITKLISKQFNTEGFESIYTFSLQTTMELNFFTRIYITFSTNVGINREHIPECYTSLKLINGSIQITDLKITYCEVIGDNRISLQFNQLININTEFYIVICGIAQPSLSNKSNLNYEIQIGIDDDTYISNGIKKFNIITDTPPETPINFQPTFSIQLLTISEYLIRQTFDLTIVFDASPIQIMDSSPLYLLFTINFSNTSVGDIMKCKIQQINTSNNLSDPICQFISQKLLRIKLSSTSPTISYLYQIIIFDIPSPQYLPELVKNQIRPILFECQSNSNIQRQSLHYNANYYSFIRDTSKIDLIWNIYTSKLTQNITNINLLVNTEELETQRTVIVHIGYFKRIIRLQPENGQNYLISLEITLQGYSNLFKFQPTNLTTIRGQEFIEFQISAFQTTPPGIYSLIATKIGDDNNIYDKIPNLKVIVSAEPCKVNPRFFQYDIPIGGISLPIEFDFKNCIPTDDVIYTPLLTNTNSNDLEFDKNYLVDKITGISKQSKMYFLLNEKTNDISKVDQSILLTFKVSQTAKHQTPYLAPNQINLKYISLNKNIPHTASPITDISIDQNKVMFSIQCSQPSIIFWVIGIDPSVSKIEFDDIKNYVTGSKGLNSYVIQSENDPQKKIFGIDISYVKKPIFKTFDSLKANSYYSFKYFCYNQMKLKSTSETINWKVPTYPTSILKITIYFDMNLKYQQQTEILCSLRNYFALPQQRIISDQNTKCNEYPNYQNLNIENLNVKNKLNSFFPYMFYIYPDFTIKENIENIDIKENIRENSFLSKFLAYLPQSQTYPQIKKIETEEIVQNESPDIALLTQIEVFSTTAQVYLKLRNMNGYIIVGLEDDKSNTSPSPDQIKKGFNVYNQNLITFELRYSQRELKQEFKFIQLKPGTDYTAYFVGSNDDPSSDGIVTQPILLNFKTSGQTYTNLIIKGSISHSKVILLLIILSLL